MYVVLVLVRLCPNTKPLTVQSKANGFRAEIFVLHTVRRIYIRRGVKTKIEQKTLMKQRNSQNFNLEFLNFKEISVERTSFGLNYICFLFGYAQIRSRYNRRLKWIFRYTYSQVFLKQEKQNL